MSNILGTIRIRVDTAESHAALDTVERRDHAVRQQVKQTERFASWSAAKIMAMLTVTRSMLFLFLDAAGISLSATHRAFVDQMFNMAMMYTYMASAHATTGQIHMAVLLGIWVSTAAWQVPCHHRLTQGFSARTHAALVYGNWVRTIGWTLRAVGLAVGAAQWG